MSEKAKRAAQEKGGQESKTNVKFMTWGSGGVVKAKDEEVAVVKDAEEGVVVEDDEGDADTPEMTLDDPMQVNTHTCHCLHANVCCANLHHANFQVRLNIDDMHIMLACHACDRQVGVSEAFQDQYAPV